MQSHHNGYSKVSSIQCVTLVVILVTHHESVKEKCYKAEVVQMQVGKSTTKASVKLDDPFKQHLLYSSSNDEAKGSISVMWCGRTVHVSKYSRNTTYTTWKCG